MDALAAKSAAFYKALHARFDLVFNDVTDRDAGFYQHVVKQSEHRVGPADFGRHDVHIGGFTRRTRTPGGALATAVKATRCSAHPGPLPGQPARCGG